MMNIGFQKDNSDFNFTVNPAGNQNHLMIGQGPAYFEAAEEMSDTENMLAVLDYLHNHPAQKAWRCKNSEGSRSGS